MKNIILLDESYSDMAIQLLRDNQLPTADFSLAKVISYGSVIQGELIAMAALEVYGQAALLRSVAVHKQYRNQGYGNTIISHIIEKSNKMNLSKLFLLTESAENFFRTIGFEPISRDQVPEEIKRSQEFTSLCPQSAVCMVYTL